MKNKFHFSPETLLKLFYRNKILTKETIFKQVGCSNMTMWRVLHSHGYITSYNFNAKYYTLADIPKFNNYGLWSYKKVNFSNVGSLTDTILAIVRNSKFGMNANELEDIMKMNVKIPLSNLYQQGKIKREKVNNRFVYVDYDLKRSHEQLTLRQAQIKKRLERLILPEPNQIIAVLVALIQKPSLNLRQLADYVSKKGCKINIEDIQAIQTHYQLSKKKLRNFRNSS